MAGVAVNYSYLTQREWSPSSFLFSFLKIRNKHTGRGSFANPLKKTLSWYSTRILDYSFLIWNNYVGNSKIWLLVLADFTSKNAESKSWCLQTKLTCETIECKRLHGRFSLKTPVTQVLRQRHQGALGTRSSLPQRRKNAMTTSFVAVGSSSTL